MLESVKRAPQFVFQIACYAVSPNPREKEKRGPVMDRDLGVGGSKSFSFPLPSEELGPPTCGSAQKKKKINHVPPK